MTSNLQRRLEKRQNNPGCLSVLGALAAGLGVFILLSAGIVAILAVILMFAWGLAAPAFGAEALAFPQAFGISLIVYIALFLLKNYAK